MSMFMIGLVVGIGAVHHDFCRGALPARTEGRARRPLAGYASASRLDVSVLPYVVAASPRPAISGPGRCLSNSWGEPVSWKMAQRAYARSGAEHGHTFFFGVDDGRTIGAQGREFHGGSGHVCAPNWRH